MNKFGTQVFRKMVDEEKGPPRRRSVRGHTDRVSTSDFRVRSPLPTGQEDIDPLLARLVLACWNRFFDCFRADELAMEFPRYEQEAKDVADAIAALQDGDIPDLQTCQKILFLLSRFNKERFNELNSRIEELSSQSKDLESKLNAVSISGSVSSDELERCGTMLEVAYGALQLSKPDLKTGERPIPKMIENLVYELERDRRILHQIADNFDPTLLHSLPVEAQMYLNFFRSQERDVTD